MVTIQLVDTNNKSQAKKFVYFYYDLYRDCLSGCRLFISTPTFRLIERNIHFLNIPTPIFFWPCATEKWWGESAPG